MYCEKHEIIEEVLVPKLNKDIAIAIKYCKNCLFIKSLSYDILTPDEVNDIILDILD